MHKTQLQKDQGPLQHNPDTIKPGEEKAEYRLQLTRTGKKLESKTPVTQEIKTTDKWYPTKLKSFYSKANMNQVTGPHLPAIIHRGFMTTVYKEFKK